ncbi:MAG: gliding motility-associated C-terminal domain-containing protein [Schleiferiaceae bacterium]|nr:gliding motility-associated C-terminal domain-containing protein [Schleiferiaceae bacterium]
MQTHLLRVTLVAIFLGFTGAYAQITNTNSPSQLCQDDEFNVTFSVTQLFNVGNTFRVELSNSAGVFSGNFIEQTPLTAISPGSYSITCDMPATTPQGGYCIRVVSTDPILVGDTICNIIVGRKPSTTITVFNTFLINGVHTFCADSTAFLVGPPPPLGETHGYQWFLNGTAIPGETNDSLLVTGTGSYSLEVTLGLCNSQSLGLIVNMLTVPNDLTAQPGPGIDILSPDSLRMCAGSTAFVDGPAPGPNQNFAYQWFTDSIGAGGLPVAYPLPTDTNRTIEITTAGRYSLIITETTGGCIGESNDYYVFVDSLPAINLIPVAIPGGPAPSLNLCFEDSVILAVDTINPNWTYAWEVSFPAGTPFQPLMNVLPGLLVDTSLVNDTALFRARITLGACEVVTNDLQVNFIPKPNVNITQGDTLGICPGDSVLLTAGGTALQYSWNGGIGLSSAFFATSPGMYVVRGVGINGCDNFDTIYVIPFTTTANAGPDQTVVPGTTVELNGSGGSGFRWWADRPVTFSNPNAATTLTEPTDDTTTYYLMVMDGNGCFAIDSMRVFIVDTNSNAPFSNVMNVITPNGDGMNDVWNIAEVIGIDVCELTILNRWGKEVYFSTNYQNNWGGTTSGGDELPDGTYYYILQCDEVVRLKGAITIMRNRK